jgi:glycine/D-amino acid oxidase-like deaminating enzyme
MRPLLVAQGVKIFESTAVERVREGKVIEVATAGGTVRAGAIVLATNGYTPRLGYFKSGILPVTSHVIATAPLAPELRASGFGTATAFSDDLPRLAYASVDLDGRLVFGGGTNTSYGYRFGNRTAVPVRPDDRAARALRRSLDAYFPALAGVAIEHRWCGPLDLTLSRHCGMGVRGSHANVYYALGYSGHGVVLANLAGRVLADLYAGNHDPWRDLVFYNYQPSGIPPEPFRWIGYHVYTKLTGRSPFKRLKSDS